MIIYSLNCLEAVVLSYKPKVGTFGKSALLEMKCIEDRLMVMISAWLVYYHIVIIFKAVEKFKLHYITVVPAMFLNSQESELH